MTVTHEDSHSFSHHLIFFQLQPALTTGISVLLKSHRYINWFAKDPFAETVYVPMPSSHYATVLTLDTSLLFPVPEHGHSLREERQPSVRR